MTPGHFHETCLLLAMIVPFSEHSGIRSSKHNSHVGGVWNSGHRIGLGKDIALDEPKRHKTLRHQAKKHLLYVKTINKTKGEYHLEPSDY